MNEDHLDPPFPYVVEPFDISLITES